MGTATWRGGFVAVGEVRMGAVGWVVAVRVGCAALQAVDCGGGPFLKTANQRMVACRVRAFAA